MMKTEQKSYGFRSCARCGLRFEARTWNQRYCSKRCKNKNRTQKRTEYFKAYREKNKDKLKARRHDYYLRVEKPERCKEKHGGCENCPHIDCIV